MTRVGDAAPRGRRVATGEVRGSPGDPADVPETTRTAIRHLIGTFAASRETVAPNSMQPISHTTEEFLGPSRALRLAA